MIIANQNLVKNSTTEKKSAPQNTTEHFAMFQLITILIAIL